MKRSRHRWLECCLLYLALFVLSSELPVASSVRATSLIFSKTSTAAPNSESDDNPTGPAGDNAQANGDGSAAETGGAIKTNYTGIPQIDYIYDPNLPRELNGYNLSDYPFFEAVPKPETINFKCDGLHDGFYASVPHKCQVYHHCLYGTRYDFLCANYTAFDQRTFICHFVSEIDCKNSPNYWSRNEALYKSASEAAPSTTSTTTTTTTTTTARPPRSGGRRRPRPRYDYYDDDDYYYARDDYEYEDRGPRRRLRPRPGMKRRPYNDYDDESYNKRPRADEEYDERRVYERRPGRRPNSGTDRRPYENRDESERRPIVRASSRRHGRPREDEDRVRDEDNDRLRPKNHNKDEDLLNKDEMISQSEDTMKGVIRSRDEIKTLRSRPGIRGRDDRRNEGRTEPVEVGEESEVSPRSEHRGYKGVDRFSDPREERGEKVRDEPLKPLKEDTSLDENTQNTRMERHGGTKRPYRNDERNGFERTKTERERSNRDKPVKIDNNDETEYTNDEKDLPTAPEITPTFVKPSGHGLFSQPRQPPKIKRPVPVNEKHKYEYVTVATTKVTPKINEDEYYYDYEEENSRQPYLSKPVQRSNNDHIDKQKSRRNPVASSSSNINFRNKPKRPIDEDYEEYYEDSVTKPGTLPPPKLNIPIKPGIDLKLLPKDDDYAEYDDKKEIKTERRNTEVVLSKEERPNMKIIKRPFLPSRGGSPYLPRGLKPVAGKDLKEPLNTTPKTTTTSTTTTSTSPSTTTSFTTTTKLTTTEARHTTQNSNLKDNLKEEYEDEYYDEEDVEYEPKDDKDIFPSKEQNSDSPKNTTIENSEFIDEKTIVVKPKDFYTKKETTNYHPQTEDKKNSTINLNIKPESTTKEKPTTPEQKANLLATKILRVYNDNYEAIRNKLDATSAPHEYLKPYLASTQKPFEQRKNEIERPEAFLLMTEPKPEISKPYTATSNPLRIPENISVKQNLANSVESDFDITLNEAFTPNLQNSKNLKSRIPTGFGFDRESPSRFRGSTTYQSDPVIAASDLYQLRKRPQISGVSIRTPSSYYLQPTSHYDRDGRTRFPRFYRPYVDFF